MARASFLVVIALFIAGLGLTLGLPSLGLAGAGLGLVGLGLWLLRFDLARRTVRQTGLTRFIALCLLPGYVWLVVGGGLWAFAAARFGGGPCYDAMLHTILLGYAFSMVFGHAPIILPAVTGQPMRYHPRFYVHLGLLHLALVMRVAGDLAAWPAARHWGGLLNEIAILMFLGSSPTAILAARNSRASSKPPALPG